MSFPTDYSAYVLLVLLMLGFFLYNVLSAILHKLDKIAKLLESLNKGDEANIQWLSSINAVLYKRLPDPERSRREF